MNRIGGKSIIIRNKDKIIEIKQEKRIYLFLKNLKNIKEKENTKLVCI